MDRYGSTTWLTGQYAKLRTQCEKAGLSPIAVLDQLITKKLSLPGTGKLVARYRQINALLQPLRDLKGKELVNALFPENIEETKLLRDSVMLIIEDDMKADPMLGACPSKRCEAFETGMFE